MSPVFDPSLSPVSHRCLRRAHSAQLSSSSRESRDRRCRNTEPRRRQNAPAFLFFVAFFLSHALLCVRLLPAKLWVPSKTLYRVAYQPIVTASQVHGVDRHGLGRALWNKMSEMMQKSEIQRQLFVILFHGNSRSAVETNRLRSVASGCEAN